MIRELIDDPHGKPIDQRADLEQLVYDMGHGSGALMHAIEHDMQGSQVWWLCERLCEQAMLLETRFLEERGNREETKEIPPCLTE
jgi:hypothetical protein